MANFWEKDEVVSETPSFWEGDKEVNASPEAVVPAAASFAPIPSPQTIPTPEADLGRMGAYLQDRAVGGFQNLLGLPGALQRLQEAGVGKGMELVGGTPEQVQAVTQMLPPMIPGIPRSAPTRPEIQGMLESAGLDPMTGAQPASETERRIGDFIEGATSAPFAPFAGGVANVAGQQSRQVAENLGFGPTGQAVAEFGGALTGGMGTQAAQRGLQFMASRPPTPGIEPLRRAKNQAYAAADNAGVVVSADRFKRAVADIGQAAKKQGLDKDVTPRASAAMRRLLSEVDDGRDLSLTEIDTLRKVIKNAADPSNKGDRAVAMAMRSELDSFLDDLKPKDLVAGDPAAVETLKQARSLNTRLSKGEQIDDMIELARENQSFFTGAGFENALRSEFRKLARNEKRMRLFTPAERDAIRAVNRGEPVSNFFRAIGRFAPTGAVSAAATGGVPFAIGSAVGGPAVGAGASAAAMGAAAASRKVAEAMTRQAATEARNTMLRGYRAPQLPSSLPAGVSAGLLGGQPSLLQEQPAMIGPVRTRGLSQ